jgi:hypothetical protein
MKPTTQATPDIQKEANPMMTQQTLTQLRSLKLGGMGDALQEQLTQPSMSSLSFEERLAMLVDREVASRDDRRRTRLLSLARLKYPQATIEDVDTRRGRGVDRGQITSLALGDWIKTGHPVIINGATGFGQDLAGLCAGSVRLPTRPHCQLPAHATAGRRVAGVAWCRQLWQVVTAAGQDRCADLG